ncbi:MAG: glycosyltransferase family 4 protein [Rhodobacteraceae bacterium]|nr:glycosyltransferase family 4 protein [Paracoccaceae bacterium]
MKVLFVAPRLNGDGVGEVRKSFELLQALIPLAEVTVLALENRIARPLKQQLTECEVITFQEPIWTRWRGRLASMLKPEIIAFNGCVRRWYRQSGRQFDIAHQILPAGARYPSALRGLGLPYVIGPVGGSLSTPEAFKKEMESEAWFTRFRALDTVRLRYDPWLRASYRNADLVLGVAPYMRETLSDLPIRRFEPFLRLGVHALAPARPRTYVPGELKLLHVGRAVRTKGLRESIRALAELPDLPKVTLTCVGDGEELPFCKAEAQRLGVADRVFFVGKQPRERVEDFYRDCDALLFPSFRESMGGVLYEAMNWGMPIITVRRGGPDWIVDETCGLKVPVTTPERMPKDLATAIRTLAEDPELCQRLGQNGRDHLEREALWSSKAQKLVSLYEEVLAARAAEKA